MKSEFFNSSISTDNLDLFLNLKDYFLTNESFKLYHINKYDLLVTNPFPSNEALPQYYDKQNYISHTDSNASLFDKIYQFAKRYAINKKVSLINTLSQKKTILDVGCGTGEFLLACKNRDWQVTGVEPNSKARDLAEQKLSQTVIYNNIKDIDNNIKYDIISLWHVLEHVPNLEEYILVLKKLLKPNGRLIIAVPNYKSYDAEYYGKFWAAYDVPRHLWHFSQKAIKTIFSEFNMSVEKTLPMKLDSFYVSLLSEKYKNGKSNPITAFFVGLRSNLKAKRSTEYSSLIYILKND